MILYYSGIPALFTCGISSDLNSSSRKRMNNHPKQYSPASGLTGMDLGSGISDASVQIPGLK